MNKFSVKLKSSSKEIVLNEEEIKFIASRLEYLLNQYDDPFSKENKPKKIKQEETVVTEIMKKFSHLTPNVVC